jgi:uncharacterized protein YndB with AHSA1/START domain
MTMNPPEFVYTTYIKATAEKVWSAITTPEFTRQYWGGRDNVSDWKKGSPWRHLDPDDPGASSVVGEVVESVPPTRLVLTWADPNDLKDSSRLTFEIQTLGDLVRLNVIHGEFKPGSIMASKISQGWPLVLSSLKSFLENGNGIDIWAAKGGKCASPVAG